MLEFIFDELNQKILKLKMLTRSIDREELAYKILPILTLEIVRKYFRMEVEGLEHIPKKGRGIIISNHSGYEGFDAVMLANEVRRAHQRIAHLVAHKLWFLGTPTRIVSQKMGFVEADTNECLKLLQKDKLLILFPEGEEGNFKPSHKRYRLQEFRRGFVRLAMISGAPIIPSFVIGAEESQINLTQIRWTKYLIGSVVPVPLNVIPLPVKWKIKFLPPVYLSHYNSVDAMNRQKVLEISNQIRRDLQRAIIKELRTRRGVV